MRQSGLRTSFQNERTFVDFLKAMADASVNRKNEKIWGSYSQLTFLEGIDKNSSFIGRFENLEHDIYKILSMIGIDHLAIPHEIENNLRERENVFGFYDNECLEIANVLFMSDFEEFGYKMEVASLQCPIQNSLG